MLSRLLDPTDGKPRDPVFWLVVAAIVATQVLALFALCEQQVRKAEERSAQAVQIQPVAQFGGKAQIYLFSDQCANSRSCTRQAFKEAFFIGNLHFYDKLSPFLVSGFYINDTGFFAQNTWQQKWVNNCHPSDAIFTF